MTEQHTERQSTVLVRSEGTVNEPWWDVSEIRLEELVLAYMRRGASSRMGTYEMAEPLSVGPSGAVR